MKPRLWLSLGGWSGLANPLLYQSGGRLRLRFSSWSFLGRRRGSLFLLMLHRSCGFARFGG